MSVFQSRITWRRNLAFDERENAAEERDSATADRDEATEERHSAARQRESVADERESVADERETAATSAAARRGRRESVADARDRVADTRDSVADEAAQRRELSYARAVLESAPDAMVIVDADGIIQLANVATETLFGYRRAMLVGRRVDMLLRYEDRHPDGRAGFFSVSGAGALNEDLDLWGQRQSGSEVAVEIRLNALESEEGLVVAAIRDVTPRRKADRLLPRAVGHRHERLWRGRRVSGHNRGAGPADCPQSELDTLTGSASVMPRRTGWFRRPAPVVAQASDRGPPDGGTRHRGARWAGGTPG